MKNLPKLSVMDSTIPAGGICKCPSKAEAELCLRQKAIERGMSFDDVILINIEVPTLYAFHYLAWCTIGGKGSELILPVFNSHGIPANTNIKAQIVDSGEVFICGNLFYRVCDDPVYRQILRQIDIFADEDVVRTTLQFAKRSKDEMDFYLVEVTKVSEPNKTLCYAWMVDIHHEDGNTKQLFPIFSDEISLITNETVLSLNWTYLHDGDCFRKDNTVYKFCRDEKHKAYITRFMSINIAPQPSD